MALEQDNAAVFNNDLVKNIDYLKGFLALDFSVDPRLIDETSTENVPELAKEKRINRKNLVKFITEDEATSSRNGMLAKDFSRKMRNELSDKKNDKITPKASYRPEIDPISEKLMVAKSSEKKGKDIWNYLHDLDKELKEKRDKTHLEKKLREEEECLNGCTFQPEISADNFLYPELYTNNSIYQRSLQWKQNIDEKYPILVNT
eukprot:TRINITY_DN15268_c0_g2_i1.p1 TRINITY_DN15268_c0_g2~~TRINITY_DN15268_c0_g2_i1.p1  ORF type:complete len:204 (-),score=53.08 TRINITY_DN15268_c0_g2_i1:572-1183(-)